MKRTHLLFPALLIGTFAVSGCYSHTYRTGLRPAQQDADHQAWQHHLIAGLFTLSSDVQLNEICPNGAAVIHNRMTFVNILVAAITGSIYAPTTVKVWCAAGGGQASLHEVEIDVTPELIEQARLIVPDFDEQLMALHAELTAQRLAAKGGATVF